MIGAGFCNVNTIIKGNRIYFAENAFSTVGTEVCNSKSGSAQKSVVSPVRTESKPLEPGLRSDWKEPTMRTWQRHPEIEKRAFD